jgi:O-Antigen ligase
VVGVVAVGMSQPNQGVLGHLVATYSSDRGRWWSIAWDAFLKAPFRGFGAGTFRIIASLAGESGVVPTSAHNALLDGLAGTGVLGGGLIVVALIGLGGVALRAAWRGTGMVAAALILAWLVHALVDVGWQAAPLGVAAGLMAGAAGATRAGMPRAACLLIAVVGAALVVSAPAPWLAQRALDQAPTVTAPAGMLAAASDALRWEPDNVQALIVEAEADQALGRMRDAQAAFARAIRAEPDNFQPWDLLGVYQLRYWHQPRLAVASLSRALGLSGGSAFVRTDLDAARAAAG